MTDLASYSKASGWLGRALRYYACTGSTNDVALAAADAGEAEGLVVIADVQQTGRGRLNRRWQAAPGSSLLVSILFRPPTPLDYYASRITMVCGLGLRGAVRELTGLSMKLKWPNDLIHEPDGDPSRWQKIAGMLSEVRVDSSQATAALVVGLGVNVNVPAEQLPGIAPRAGSLSAIVGRSVSRAALLDVLLQRVERGYDALRSGVDPYHTWRDAVAWLGRDVEVVRGADRVRVAERVRGTAADVDQDGNLLLRTETGQMLTFSAGDVSLRPA